MAAIIAKCSLGEGSTYDGGNPVVPLNFSGEGSTYDEEMWTCWLHQKGNASDHLKKVILQKDHDGDSYVSSNGIVVTPISTFDL